MRWLTNKAIALDLLKQHTQAQELYKQALADSPGDPVILSNYGLSLALSGNKAEANKVIAPLIGQADLMPTYGLQPDQIAQSVREQLHAREPHAKRA